MSKSSVPNERARWGRIAVAAALALSFATPSLASEIEGEDASERLYLKYCSSCHGTSGVGDGPLAALLELKPADLTQYSKANGGIFPFHSVLTAIDGRLTVRAHGDSGMPVWGRVLAPEPGASMRDRLAAYGRLFLITFYVESLQEPGDAGKR